jgi:hypothetical protein
MIQLLVAKGVIACFGRLSPAILEIENQKIAMLWQKLLDIDRFSW